MPDALLTVLRIVAVDIDGGQMDCCDTETVHVWVMVPAWSPRRAFRTGARVFLDASGLDAGALVGARFFTRLDLDNPPGNDDTNGERLEWPDLRLCPPLPESWTGPTGRVDGAPAGGEA
ncbi:hypothetical protein ACFRQM_09615 [Streptomyces sp. NPDC056831]|uniref:hypothetical protein n=1 Tax=Streptomyces sp. NPDC056831 TaxID=3345954 RepID=UPI0036B2DD59